MQNSAGIVDFSPSYACIVEVSQIHSFHSPTPTHRTLREPAARAVRRRRREAGRFALRDWRPAAMLLGSSATAAMFRVSRSGKGRRGRRFDGERSYAKLSHQSGVAREEREILAR